MAVTDLNSPIYKDIEKGKRFWDALKPDIGTPVVYLDKWQKLFPFLDQLSAQNCVVILLWDAISGRFVHAVDKRNVVGHKMSSYMAQDGLDFTISNVHTDFLTAGLLIQQMGVEYINQNRGVQRDKIIVNFDGMYKKANGDYMHYLQQVVCVESDNEGHPFLYLSYIHDITYLKKEKTANLIITTPEEILLWNFNFNKQCLETVQPLTVQEKKVLAYLGQNKNSKDIATELFVSSHTIDTHRRNLLKKTNCLDTTGLVTYAKLVGLFS